MCSCLLSSLLPGVYGVISFDWKYAAFESFAPGKVPDDLLWVSVAVIAHGQLGCITYIPKICPVQGVSFTPKFVFSPEVCSVQ